MKIEKLNYGKEKNKRMFLYGFLVAVVLLILVNIIASKAMYRKTESVQLANGTINYTPYDFKIMAMYQETSAKGKYEEITIMPGSEYVINESKSYCTLDNKVHDNKAVLKTFEGRHIISHLTKQDKCYLYFDREQSAASKTVFSLGLKTEGAIDSITGPACIESSANCGGEGTNMKQNGLYYAGEDDDGPSYVFRGTVDNNWVKFGKDKSNQDIWWRIIRINGNGSIRLIYSGEGTPPTGNGKNAIDNQAYNTTRTDNTYVGYYYGSPNQKTYEATHSNTIQNNIASKTEDWFKNTTKLNTDEYLKYIDENVGFCNNRQISKNPQDWLTDEGIENRGTGIVKTAYKGFYKVATNNNSWRRDKQYPDLRCSSNPENFEENADYKRDYYTWKDHASRGNQALVYPVGQITIDEVILAGGFGGRTNSDYWLNSGTFYWTMTPRDFDGSNASVFTVNYDGYLGTYADWTIPGIRPVINLKAETKFTFTGNGDKGTTANPYIVSD